MMKKLLTRLILLAQTTTGKQHPLSISRPAGIELCGSFFLNNLEFSEIVRIFASEKERKLVTMNTATIDRRSANSYWNMLRHLSPDTKLELITLLSKSLQTTRKHHVSAKKYYGIWGDDGISDEEFLDEMKSMRSFKNDIVEL